MSPDDTRVPGCRKQVTKAPFPSSADSTEIEYLYDEGFESFQIDQEDFGVQPNDDWDIYINLYIQLIDSILTIYSVILS